VYDKAAARAAIDARRQPDLVPMAAARAILRRVRRIHLDYLSAGAFSLARKDQDELAPSRVTDALGEMMIPDHPSHVQIFDGNRVKLSHDIERSLVVKVRALASYLLVLLRQQIGCFSSSLRSLLTSGDFALSSLQLRFGLTQKFRVLNHLARRESGEILNPDIYANRVARLRKESALVLFNCKDHIPTIHIALDHAGLDYPLDRTGEADATRTNFRQVKLVAFETKAALRIGEGIVPRSGLESRIPRRFAILHAAKEGVEGLIHAAQGVLKNLAMNPAHVLTDLFDLRKLDGLGVIIDRNAVDPVGVTTFLQGGVVQLAAKVERGDASRLKFRTGLQLVFVCLQFPHYTLVTMATQQLQALHHCVFKLQHHLVIATKCRRKVIAEEVKKRLGEIFFDTLLKWECELIEFNGEADHVHLLFSATPKASLSVLVNNLKTVSSRLIRKEFKREVSKVYWKPVFWHRSYCLLTSGGAPLSVIKQYIQQQGEP
jgi:putative transposase